MNANNAHAFPGMRMETMDEVEDRCINLRQSFPHAAIFAKESDRQLIYQEGMQLRDYFAAKALQGICASGPCSDLSDEFLAREAYNLAEAMMEARK